jgi:hypothetical protein
LKEKFFSDSQPASESASQQINKLFNKINRIVLSTRSNMVSFRAGSAESRSYTKTERV